MKSASLLIMLVMALTLRSADRMSRLCNLFLYLEQRHLLKPKFLLPLVVPLVAFAQLTYAQEQIRTLHFPSGKTIGMIFVGNDKDIFGSFAAYRQVAKASGTFQVHVPSGQRVLFEANRRVFENPACLDLVSPQGIDILKIGLISLDDSEDGMCDKALEQAVHFQGVQEIDADRSEATDKGIAKLRAIPSLMGISCYSTSINGACFKDLATLPALKALWLSHNVLNQRNLEYLKSFPKLQVLNVDRTHLDLIGTRSLAKCTNLKDLSVRGNQDFGDNCLSLICSLKNLTSLDLRETPVTVAGVKQLRVLKLKKLVLPRALTKNLPELKKLFSQANLSADSSQTTVGEEDKEMYAPLK
jgi:hypothetical protein